MLDGVVPPPSVVPVKVIPPESTALLMVISLGSINHSPALTLTLSVFKYSPEVSIKPCLASNRAPLTSVVLANLAVAGSRPMMMLPPLLTSSVLLAVMLPSTLIAPWSAKIVTSPACWPLVSI